MISIKEVAKHCGVSVATVSKALNGYSDISEDTKEKIIKAANELGYFPNSLARALKTNKSYNIGVIYNDDTESGLSHEYFGAILQSFKVCVEKSGYDVTFINNTIGDKKVSYLDHCKYRSLDGVFIASLVSDNIDVIQLANSDIPVVTIDHKFNNKSAVFSDNISGIRDLVNYIYSMGHRRIAFIHGQYTSVTQNRLISFYKTLEEYGVSIKDEYVRKGAFHDPKITAELTRKILDLPSRPTCIMFPDDFSAVGGINVIHERGLKIPRDISVVGYDGILLSRVLSPKLTTYKQDTKMLGQRAAEQLIKHIEKPKTTLPETIVVKGELQIGNSVGELL
ncbi:LacI family DNA-binding transcriptional regulator [Clostridium thermarum]|uniref:LacI family DNA-binding transcriptional regulator n=1 Tax=Clostridium thermarum TaxID=1716543 RepID=UPI00111F678C|nr:LacI family DNA-binding transcriptional regulator [Clostridium thermarum]